MPRELRTWGVLIELSGLCLLLGAVACGGGSSKPAPSTIDNDASSPEPRETVATFDAHQVRIVEHHARNGILEVHGKPLSGLDQARHVMELVCSGEYHWAFASDFDAKTFDYARRFDHPETMFWNVRYDCR